MCIESFEHSKSQKRQRQTHHTDPSRLQTEIRIGKTCQSPNNEANDYRSWSQLLSFNKWDRRSWIFRKRISWQQLFGLRGQMSRSRLRFVKLRRAHCPSF